MLLYISQGFVAGWTMLCISTRCENGALLRHLYPKNPNICQDRLGTQRRGKLGNIKTTFVSARQGLSETRGRAAGEVGGDHGGGDVGAGEEGAACQSAETCRVLHYAA